MVKLEVTYEGQNEVRELNIPYGTALVDVENVFRFACKAGACGRCLVHVVTGGENLNPVVGRELRGLGVFAKGETKMRLACQVKLLGDCRLQVGV